MYPSKLFPVFILVIIFSANTNAQIIPTTSPDDYINTIQTAVPFLLVPTDARSAALGNSGLATSPDAGSIFLNAAKLAFIPEKNPFGLSISYLPWLSELVEGFYIADISTFIKLDDEQALSLGTRYFSLGTLTFTSATGNVISEFRPNELTVDAAYARKLSPNFSAGLTLKYIYSNLTTLPGFTANDNQPVQDIAGDISLFYTNSISEKSELNAGLVIKNIGGKMWYTNIITKDYLPTNLGIGLGYSYNIAQNHQISISGEVNKLLVPTPDTADIDPANGIFDFREYSAMQGMLTSFSDAPQGFSEEIDEINYRAGLEYLMYEIFAARVGYFYEAPSKGGRQYFTLGAGIQYSSFALDLGYQSPIGNQNSVLNKTFSMTLQILIDKS
ncbi:MAG: type IX secretion system outer membrane channel protein PorV [Bacteroidetes bacterium]|nr:type IX secretion system outer membrane channel protein PorV [Bacteroidota bacterium]